MLNKKPLIFHIHKIKKREIIKETDKISSKESYSNNRRLPWSKEVKCEYI